MRSTLTTLVLALSALPLATAASAASTWQAIGPAGGATQSLATAGDLAYAGTAGGVVASSDGGRSWVRLDAAPPRPYALAVQPGDPRHVWVAALAPDQNDSTPGGVFESRDGGTTWLRRSAGLTSPEGRFRFVYAFAFDPASGTPHVATQEGVLALRDGVWQHLGLDGDEVIALAFSPHAAGVVFAGVFSLVPQHDPESGILRSDDGGLTWRRVGDMWEIASQFAFDRQDPQRILALGYGVTRSIDGGLTFLSVSQRRDLTGLAALPGGTFVAASTHGALRSRDGGATWQRAALGQEPLNAVAAQGTQEVLAAGGRGVWRSADGAATFRPSSTGYSAQSASGLAADGAGNVLVGLAAHGGAMRSRDSGGHWTAVSGLATASADAPTLSPAPSQPGTFYAANLDGGSVARSLDGGMTWTTRGTPTYGFVSALTVDPNDAETLYLAQSESNGRDLTSCTQKSTDGGATFTCLHAVGSDNYGSRLFSNMIAVRPGDGDFLLDVAGGLARSRDGGVHWTFLTQALPSDVSATAAAFLPADPRRILLGTSSGVFVSTDDGSHWGRSSRGLPPGAVVATVVPDPESSVVYAGVLRRSTTSKRLPGEVYRSADGGRSWQRLGDRLPSEFTGALALDATHRVLYAATDGRGVLRLTLDAAD